MNIAFAGFRHGHIWGLYDKVLQSEDVQIVGCCEEDAAVRKSIEDSKGISFAYNTYEELLKDEKVEVVAIGDYFSKRGGMIIEALKHGKHVICDKPICTDLHELEEIERLSLERQLQVGCLLDLRYMAQVKTVKAMIQNGELGEIHIISFTGQHCLDYENRSKWYFEEGKHGGTINDLAIHGMDLVRFITGKNLTRINCAKTWNAFADKALDFKDSAQFMVEMEQISVMADVSYSAPKCLSVIPTYWRFQLWGTKGMMYFDYTDRSIHVFRTGMAEELIVCEPGENKCLKDFIKETKGIKTTLNTKGILESQRQTLQIQEFADLYDMC